MPAELTPASHHAFQIEPVPIRPTEASPILISRRDALKILAKTGIGIGIGGFATAVITHNQVNNIRNEIHELEKNNLPNNVADVDNERLELEEAKKITNIGLGATVYGFGLFKIGDQLSKNPDVLDKFAGIADNFSNFIHSKTKRLKSFTHPSQNTQG